MNQKGFGLPIIFLVLVLISVAFIAGFNFKSVPKIETGVSNRQASPTPDNKQYQPGYNFLEYFKEKKLEDFVELKAKVTPEKITRVFPISLAKTDEKEKQGWLVEVDKGESGYPNLKSYSYYLLTPSLTKELEDVMGNLSQEQRLDCILDKVVEIGNQDYGKGLQEKAGYIILSGEKCYGYGTAYIGFTSIYTISKGEKIKFKGDFSIPGVAYLRGVSPSGNPLGRFKGVFGINNPMVIIEYGYFDNSNEFERLHQIAFFDLQTGQLKQLVKFD